MADKTNTEPRKPAAPRKRKNTEAAAPAPQVAPAAPAPEAAPQDPQVLLRRAMAGNYLTHCHHARVAECQAQGGNPLEIGLMDATGELAMAALESVAPGDMPLMIRAMASGLGNVKIGDKPLTLAMMELYVAELALQGRAHLTLGSLRDVVARIERDQVQQQCYAAMQAMAQTVEPAAEVAA